MDCISTKVKDMFLNGAKSVKVTFDVGGEMMYKVIHSMEDFELQVQFAEQTETSIVDAEVFI